MSHAPFDVFSIILGALHHSIFHKKDHAVERTIQDVLVEKKSFILPILQVVETSLRMVRIPRAKIRMVSLKDLSLIFKSSTSQLIMLL